MDLLQMLLTYVPLYLIAAVMGMTFAVGKVFEDKTTKAAPDWLVAVPFLAGGALGTMNYFIVTPIAQIQANPFWLSLISSVGVGAGMAGAEVGLWELWAKKKFNQDTQEKVPQ